MDTMKIIEENHNLILEALEDFKLDFEDYYDVVAIYYVETANQYFNMFSEIEKFATFCKSQLNEKIKKYLKAKEKNKDVLDISESISSLRVDSDDIQNDSLLSYKLDYLSDIEAIEIFGNSNWIEFALDQLLDSKDITYEEYAICKEYYCNNKNMNEIHKSNNISLGKIRRCISNSNRWIRSFYRNRELKIRRMIEK